MLGRARLACASMGFGDTSKKDKKAAAAAEAEMQRKAAEEDASWAEGGKKANKKKEAEAEKAAAKAARKAEADEQLRQEEEDMSAPKGDKKKKDKPKMTRAEIAAKAMAKMAEAEKAKKKEQKEIEDSGGNEYIGVLAPNENKSDAISGSGLDDAIGALELASGGSSSGAAVASKKVNLKALYAAFEEREIERLRQENPGLKLSQLKERAHKSWQSSHENPANQDAS